MSLLLDIMVEGRFYCQVNYPVPPKKIVSSDGSVIDNYDAKDIEDYVLLKRPSLKSKHYRIEFSNQRL